MWNDTKCVNGMHGFCSVLFTPIKRKLNEICIVPVCQLFQKGTHVLPFRHFPNVPITSIAWIRNIWKLKQRSWLLPTKDNTQHNLNMTLRDDGLHWHCASPSSIVLDIILSVANFSPRMQHSVDTFYLISVVM